jgi:transcriptional regulator with XRE-family HTH domain
LTQTEIARRMGLNSYQMVGQWVNNKKTPETENLIGFAQAVGVSLEELIDAEAFKKMFVEATSQVAAGASIPEAIRRSTGAEAPPGVDGHTDALRTLLEERLPQAWTSMSPEDQGKLADLILSAFYRGTRREG